MPRNCCIALLTMIKQSVIEQQAISSGTGIAMATTNNVPWVTLSITDDECITFCKARSTICAHA